MSGARAHRVFLGLFVVVAPLAFLAGSVGQVTFDNLQCRTSGYAAGGFLAYCRSEQYADYEHAALYYGIEPGVVGSLRSAQVLFLGSSKTQAGFSTGAVRRYFEGRGVRFFVMGWGYGEWSPFALAVIKGWHLSPGVLVINADPFFSDKLSPPARDALDGDGPFLWRLTLKMLFQRVHRAVCSLPWPRCSERAPSIFRSPTDGQWDWIGPYIAEQSTPIVRAAQQTITPAEFALATEIGERFLGEVGLDRRCVVLTGTPNSMLDSPGIAERLALALRTRTLTPPADGLATIDGGHLNRASAERWSWRLVEALTPILDECLPALASRPSAGHHRTRP